MKRQFALAILVSVLSGTVLVGQITQHSKAESKTWTVDDDRPADFRTISEALYSSLVQNGDSVLVRSGTYYEHLTITKAIHLLGENTSDTIIDGVGTGTVMHIVSLGSSISGFTIRSGSTGIDVEGGDSIIQDCNVSSNYYGIVGGGASNLTLLANDVSHNHHGVMLSGGYNVTLRNNSIHDNDYNFRVLEGGMLSDYILDADSSNTVNWKPMCYWIDRHDEKVPSEAGYVALVNCTNMTIQNLNLMNNGQGIVLIGTNDSLIRHNSLTRNDVGVLLGDGRNPSHNNTVQDNNITHNNRGISVGSSNDTVLENNIESNEEGIYITSGPHLIVSFNLLKDNRILNNSIGIYFWGSAYNTVIANDITNNICGMRVLGSSSYNKFFHNDFVDNGVHVTVQYVVNTWDDGYPSGGNFWSDYMTKYPNAKEIGNSGVGDTAYTLDVYNIDNYPLMKAFSDTTPPNIGTLFQEPPTDNVTQNESVAVYVNITDAESGVKNATLHYNLNNTATWTAIVMSYNSTSQLYCATLPGQSQGTYVTYNISAYDNAENLAVKDGVGQDYTVVPEFSVFLIIPLFIAATLPVVIVFKRKLARPKHQCMRS